MVRAFVAIRPAAEVLDRIAAFLEELRDVGGDVRWVRPESLHATVQFLGEVPEREVPAIERALEATYRHQAPLDVECRGAGVFPGWRRPRVVWVGLRGEGLEALAERTEAALAPLGFPPAEREFRPHVTLGRVRSSRGFEPVAARLRAATDSSFGRSRIECAVLFRSELRPTGPVYSALATLRFGAVNR
jgi:2'-5' RNA ligase